VNVTLATDSIFINDGTLNNVEGWIFALYLIAVSISIPYAAYKAHKNRKLGLDAYHTAQMKCAKDPHPGYVGAKRYGNSDEAYAVGKRQFREDNGKKYGPNLWLHKLLPAIIGTLFGFILMILGTFARWVHDKGNTWHNTVSGGAPDVLLAIIMWIGLFLAVFLPIELVTKDRNRYFDYVLALWAAFGVAYAATMLGF